MLYLDNGNPGSDSHANCTLNTLVSSGDYLMCSVSRWNMFPNVGSERIRAELFDEMGKLLVSVDDFCTVSLS